MSKKLLSTLIAGLFVAAPAWGQTEFVAEGSVTLGGMWVDRDSNDPSKFLEYQDISNGVRSMFEGRGRGGNNWVEGYAENIGRDDQFMMIRGGMYDVFRYKLYSNSLRHNFLLGGLTPFSGVGSNTLIATFPQPNPATWNRFNLFYDRTDNGGFFEWQRNAPWYFRADANQVKFDGTRLGAASNGTSPGNGYVDLIFPQQYTTNNVAVEGGYNTGKMNISVSYMHSKFENDFETIRWSNPFWSNQLDTTYLAPSNDFDRFQATGTFRSLPWNSTLAARYTWTRTESDFDLATTALNGTGATAFALTRPNVSTFNGEHVTQTLNLALTSNPARAVDTRLYYNFNQLDNNSTHVEYGGAPSLPLASGLGCATQAGLTPGSSVVGNCDNHLFGYKKHNIGAEAYWRFAQGQRFGGGIDYIDATYDERPDYDEAQFTRIFLEYKNSVLPNLSGRIKYTYLDRDSHYLESDAGTGPGDPNYLLRFTSAYDLSPLQRHELKLTGDWSPAQFVDVNAEVTWKDNDYDVILGRTNDKRFEVYGSVSFGDPNRFRVTVFGDYEKVRYDSDHRYIGTSPCNAASGPNCFDVASPPNATAYNWQSQSQDKNWMVGVGADWPVTPQLLLKGSLLYVETDGSADFQTQQAGGAFLPCSIGQPVNECGFGAPIPLTEWDDTERVSVNLKGIYQLNRSWAFTLGYAFEKWRLKDQAMSNGFVNTIPFPGVSNNTSQSYLSGYLADTNYDSHIVYLLATFRF